MPFQPYPFGKKRYQNKDGHWREVTELRLVHVATTRRKKIGPKGEPRRRCFPPLEDGSYYHATKGWRGR
jgi:hypothetical protein